jgi:D-amino peptidase
MLDERAEYDPRSEEEWWGKLDDRCDGTFFVGAHAMAGTINGFLDHTQSFYVFNYSVNGRRMGEVEQWAIVAGGFGVPLLMVSGDEAGCAEARAFLSPIETAAVKQGLGRNRAAAYPAGEARERIRQSARRAVDLVGEAQPFKPLLPMEIKVEYTRTDRCDRDARREGVERLDARTVRMVTSDPLDILPWRRPFREA